MAAAVLACVLVALLSPAAAAAIEVPEEQPPVQIYLDGTVLPVTGFILYDRTMVPLRAVAEAMGMAVTWEPVERKVTVSGGGLDLNLKIEQDIAYNGEQELYITPAPIIRDSVTYVPVRFLADGLGFTVDWAPGSRSVSLARTMQNPVRFYTVTDVRAVGNLMIDIRTPRIDGLQEDAINESAKSAFNLYFEKRAADWLEQALKNRAELDNSTTDPRDTTQVETTAMSRYRITYNRNDLVCVVLTEYEYTGGAHGMTYQSSYIINIKTGEVYSLADLFEEGSDYVSQINAHVKRGFTDRGLDIVLLEPFESISPDEDFYLYGNDLVIYFQLYEYTPYAAGFQEFAIPLNSLEGVVVPGS